MAVPGGGDEAEAPEQVELHPVGAGKGGVGPVLVPLVEAVLIVFVHKLPVRREQIQPLVGCPVKPGEVVDAQHVHVDVPPGGGGNAQRLPRRRGQHLLGVEHLVAAAEGLDLREHAVERLDAQGHGVGVVDDPRAGAAVPDGLGDGDVHGQGAQGADDAPRPRCVPHRLPDVQPLRQVDVCLHLVKGARQNGDDHEVRPREGLLQALRHPVAPPPPGGGQAVYFVPDDLVGLGRRPVDVVQRHLPAHGRLHGQIGHEAPGPAPGTAPDVGQANAAHPVSIALVPHPNPPQSPPYSPWRNSRAWTALWLVVFSRVAWI